MALIDLVNSLFEQGLGELFILHTMKDKIYLGKMSYEKERLVVRDQDYLSGINSDQLLPCWENGILGAICNTEGQEWKSLTFCGLEQCLIPNEDLLSKTSHRALVAAENEYGEKLVDFFGSVYRGYQLMLNNHFLPVVLLSNIRIKKGGNGLVVSNLRAAPLSISIINNMHNVVMESVEKKLALEIEDVQIDPNQFNKLFSNYMPED